MSETKKVAEYLKANPGTRVCDDCLAERVSVSPSDLSEALKAVAYMNGIYRGQGKCWFCHNEKEITGFLLG